MNEIALCSSTGVVQIDKQIGSAIGVIEAHFPGRVRGYYLVGSYAVGAARPGSDIDLITLFKGDLTPQERERFVLVRAECRRTSAVPLDLPLDSEAKLFRVGGVWFQTASVLMYGEDVRALVPRKPVAQHTRDLMHAVFPLLARIRGNPASLSVPLDYPEPAGALYGYDLRYRDDSPLRRVGTKDLVSNVLAMANALTLLAAQQYAGSGKKSDIPEQYRSWVGDEWAALVEEVFEYCRLRWDYAVPTAANEYARLRRLCEQTLAFENHFLLRYRAFLRAESQAEDVLIQRLAAQRLGQLVYRDAA